MDGTTTRHITDSGLITLIYGLHIVVAARVLDFDSE